MESFDLRLTATAIFFASVRTDNWTGWIYTNFSDNASWRTGWNYNTQVAEEILNIQDTRQYRSIRELASVYGKSRQLVFVYLEAMVSIGMVGINGNGYFVISRDGICKLGTSIQPGRLSKIRKESGLKPKPRMRKATGRVC